MKVWKSPVFYFGILLVVAVIGLLAAPFVVDWNRYRADLENYGRQLTGRPVTIDGDISARLFPWPRLTADNIHIGNPAGLDEPEFASAGRMVVRITLAGLFRGTVDVEAIEIEKPVIELERLATGEGNWLFKPARALSESQLLSRVKLDAITITDGTVRFKDRRRGETVELTDINAAISSPSLAGPWRMHAETVHGPRALDIGVTTGVWQPEEAFRFGVRVAPADGSGLVFAVDGTLADTGRVDGELRIEPATTGDGKGDAEGQLRPLAFTSRLQATFDAVSLDQIEIAPSDPKEGGALITGSGRLTLGRHITAQADLSAAMLDLDELAGAQARTLLREAGSLAVADGLLSLLPSDTSLAGRAKVTALKVGGDTLDNVSLALEADSNAIRISKFSAGLPGRSQALFKGVFFPGAGGSELAGSLALESNDLRQLAFWVWPEGRDSLSPYWTGSRGHLKLQTDVNMTPTRLRFAKTQYEIDGEAGSGELSVVSGGRQSIDLRIDGKRIDIDSFMPQGISAISGKDQGLGGLIAAAMPRKGAPDLRLTLQAGELLLNGVSAADIALDLASGVNGLDLRTVEIGSVGGARLEASGLIIDSGRGADGAVGIDVKAEDPRGLLRLLGLIRGERDPAWSFGLGPTALKGNLTVKPSKQGPGMAFDLAGTAGELTVAGKGELSAARDISLQASIDSHTSGRLFRLMGMRPLSPDTLPGRIEINAAGTPGDGFMTNAVVEAYGARGDYAGSFDPAAAGYGLDGKLALRATNAGPLVEALGIPVAALPADVLVIDAGVKAAGGKTVFSGIEGRLGGGRIRGNLDVDSSFVASGRLETGDLALRDVLAAAFLDWAGPGGDLEAGFASALPLGLTGELWVRPAALEISPEFIARETEIGIIVAKDEIRLALFGKDSQGRDAHIEVASSGTSSSRSLTGRINLPVRLGNQLRLAGGQPVAEGQGIIDLAFQAQGRSPGGALAGLSGSGSYSFDDLRLTGLSPAAFTEALSKVDDATGITAAFDALRGGEGLDFGATNGTITIVNGEVAFLPFSVSTQDADVTVKTVAELGLGEIDAGITVSLKARPGLPPMEISYAGPPMQLARSEDNTELATMLGITLMQKGVDELERLQREQKRLAEQEKQQRIEDQERLEAYYAQRDEVLLRKRELKVHAEMRVVAAERLRQQLEAERAANRELNKAELQQRKREIRLHRRMARLAAARPPAPKPKAAEASPAPPKQSRARTIEPVILEQPEGAPVVISPDPSAPPSQ